MVNQVFVSGIAGVLTVGPGAHGYATTSDIYFVFSVHFLRATGSEYASAIGSETTFTRRANFFLRMYQNQ